MFNDIPTALAAINAYAYAPPASLPQPAKDHMITAAGQMSPVDKVVQSAEILFAYYDDLTIAGKELLYGCAGLATMFGWHSYSGPEQRGMKLVQAARRGLGHESPTGSWPAREDDPAPDSRYLPEPEPEAPPAPEEEAPVPEGEAE